MNQSESQELLQTAQVLHYKKHKFLEAMDLYKLILEIHPDSPEAEIARKELANLEAGSTAKPGKPIKPVQKPAQAETAAAALQPRQAPARHGVPPLAVLSYTLTFLAIAAGLFFAAALWPGLGFNKSAVAWLPAIALLVAGLLAALLFLILGKIATEICSVRERLESVADLPDKKNNKSHKVP